MILPGGIRVSSNGSELGDDLMRGFVEIHRAYERREREFADKMRALGYDAAHPNNGWVTRDAQGIALSVQFVDELFRKRPMAVGDTVVIFTLNGRNEYEYAVYRVTGYKDNPWAFNAEEARKYFLEVVT